MKCTLCGLELGLCDGPKFEYVGKRKRWYHDCCHKYRYPCRSLLQHLIKRRMEVPHAPDTKS